MLNSNQNNEAANQERFAVFLEYYLANQPSPEELERFKESIESQQMNFPLYCKETDTMSGVVELLYTLAIAHDLETGHFGSFSERYCFENPVIALEQLAEWHSRGFDDQRPTGWVATRKISSSSIKESFSKYHGDDYGLDVLEYCRELCGDHEAIYYSTIRDYKAEIADKLGYDVDKVMHLAAFLKEVGVIG
ncbi:hypothetical protein ACQKQC_26015 [Vibrio fortis]|uniref:hypothetical protein n=1 Tax=Vibrio fortis TaxID=212667 RepID=UPI0040676063